MTDTTLPATAAAAPVPARRRFLGSAVAGIAGAAAMTAPMVSVAQSPVVLKMQGAWGAKDIFNETASSATPTTWAHSSAGGSMPNPCPGPRCAC